MATLTETELNKLTKAQLVEQHIALQTENITQFELITELSNELASKPLPEKEKVVNTVSVDGIKYRIAIGKFKFKGVEKTASDLKTDSDLCKELIKAGSGVLKAI